VPKSTLLTNNGLNAAVLGPLLGVPDRGLHQGKMLAWVQSQVHSVPGPELEVSKSGSEL
jgi:hypothetical protein